MTNQPVHVLVVGAGPVGLTMAAALTHHDLKCRLIDKAAEPTDKSKALVVWSRTLELLDNLDLATTFVETGMKIDGASIYGSGKRLVHLAISGLNSPFGFPLMIPQSETERLLTEHLKEKGVDVERQVELLTFTEQDDSLVGKLRHTDGREESFTVPWLIGCDGAHSTVRHTLGMHFIGHAEPNDWLLADVHIEGTLSTTEISVFWHEKGVLVLFPISKDRFRVIADIGKAGVDRPADPTLAEVQAKVDERGPGGLKLVDPVWLAGFRINERKVTDYRKGRVMLAGDAAHIHSPAGGQGMNTGMQDAFNLAWKLALIQRGQGQAKPLLDSYSQERSAIGDQVLRGAEKMTQIATLRNPVAQFLRNHIASVVSSFGFVQDKIKNALCELSINYRHSALSVEDWPMGRGGEAAGDRLGDAPLLSAQNGKPTTLFRVIHGTRHALLLLPSVNDQDTVSALLKITKEAEQAYPNVMSTNLILKTAANLTAHSQVPVWLDADGTVHRQLGANDNTLVLVRPDGYIGYRCQPADGKALLQYLGRYLKS
ncbi:MAG TPA: FAD-dependent monooxygenase [Gemmatales bacterium]|nr:FAD-dependent monooxygenase [Gemmatales bacterium]